MQWLAVDAGQSLWPCMDARNDGQVQGTQRCIASVLVHDFDWRCVPAWLVCQRSFFF